MAICLKCNGSGRTSKDPFKCEDCGTEYKKTSINEVVNNSGIYIPSKYREDIWDANKAKEGNRETYHNKEQIANADKWVDVLNSLMGSVEKKRLIPGTFFVSAAQGSSKTRWAYALQLVAHANGFQIAQIVDAYDINMDMGVDDILDADILIVRITNYKVREVMEKLNYLLPKRRERDLTTVLLTTMPFNYLNTQIDYLSFEIDYNVQMFS